MNDELNDDASEEEEALSPELTELTALAKEASASNLRDDLEEPSDDKPEKTNPLKRPRPSDSEPNYREIKRLLDGEHPDANGARLLFRLGKLVCNLPLEKTKERIWQIGRNGDHLDLAVPLPSMSRRHFQIRFDNGLAEFYISDRKSHNGTFHNRRRLDSEGREEVLGRGDWILAGGHYFLFVDDDETNY